MEKGLENTLNYLQNPQDNQTQNQNQQKDVHAGLGSFR